MLRLSRFAVALTVLLAACGQQNSEPSGANAAIEEYISGYRSGEYQLRLAELVESCARWNGLDGYVDVPRQGVALDPAPGLEGQERLLAIGTGQVALEYLAQQPRLNPNPVIPESYELVLDRGPVVDPLTDERFGGGCRRWAEEELEDDEENQRRRQVSANYGAWMLERYFSSTEYVEIEAAQFACVAEQGFGDITRPEDLDDYLETEIRLWQSGAQTYEEALEADRAIGVVYSGCYDSVADRYNDLVDRIAAEFLESSGLVLDQSGGTED